MNKLSTLTWLTSKLIFTQSELFNLGPALLFTVLNPTELWFNINQESRSAIQVILVLARSLQKLP